MWANISETLRQRTGKNCNHKTFTNEGQMQLVAVFTAIGRSDCYKFPFLFLNLLTLTPGNTGSR